MCVYEGVRVLVRVCVCACVRVCLCVCVCGCVVDGCVQWMSVFVPACTYLNPCCQHLR